MRWLGFVFFVFPSIILANPVKTQSVSELVYFPKYEFSAQVVARNHSAVSAQTSGQLLALTVEKGQVLPAGKVFAEIDCRDYQDQFALNQSAQTELQANLRLARLQLQRLSDLQSRNLASDSARDEAQTRKQSLSAQLESLQLQSKVIERNIERCQIKAPFSGVVTEKMVGPGQWLNPGVAIVQMVELEQAEIEARLPAAFSVQESALEATWTGVQGNSTTVKFLRKSQVLAPQSKMQTLWFSAPKNAMIGEQGRIQIRGQQPFLPAGIIVQRQGQFGVFEIVNSTAVFRVIQGAQSGQPIKLPAGWQHKMLVVDGQLSLQNGDKVQEPLIESD